jgi:branched-chain amino acid aminotransferase
MEGVVFAGGRFRPAGEAVVSVFDHGLLYGDGVFEGIRAYEGRVFKLERHIERLFDSAKAIRLDIPLAADEVAQLVLETCRRNDIVNGYIRLVVTRGAGDLGINPRSCPRADVIVIARQVAPLYQCQQSSSHSLGPHLPAPRVGASGAASSNKPGVTLVTSSLRRCAPDALSPSIKSLNYLNNVLARIEANDRDADEALLLDQHGFVAEATADNVFIMSGGVLKTPPTATTLKGITRETVLELARELAIPAEEKAFTLVDMWTAGEAFMCGTMAEVVPIISVDGRTIGSGERGAVTARLVTAYDKLVRSTGTPILQVEREAVSL